MKFKANDNCKRCVHRERFASIDSDIILYLCMSEPYEEDEQFGIITWLDVEDFHSDECMNFKEK